MPAGVRQGAPYLNWQMVSWFAELEMGRIGNGSSRVAVLAVVAVCRRDL